MASHTATGASAKQSPTHVAAVPPRAQSSTKPVPQLFSGLSSGDIANVMAAGVVRRFAAGQTIVRADDPGTQLFLIKTGSVDFYRLTPEGQTVRDTELYVWEHAWVRHFAGKHPVLTENALRIGLEYIRLYSDRHLALVSDNAEDRLRRMLSLVGSRTGQRNARGLEIQITNECLASLADIGYYTTSRLLNKWKRKGAVEKSRGKIFVLCPERMLA